MGAHLQTFPLSSIFPLLIHRGPVPVPPSAWELWLGFRDLPAMGAVSILELTVNSGSSWVSQAPNLHLAMQLLICQKDGEIVKVKPKHGSKQFHRCFIYIKNTVSINNYDKNVLYTSIEVITIERITVLAQWKVHRPLNLTEISINELNVCPFAKTYISLGDKQYHASSWRI